jgi:hypothetical protein
MDVTAEGNISDAGGNRIPLSQLIANLSTTGYNISE